MAIPTVYYTRAQLVRDINIKLAGESLTWAQLQLYVDNVIDDINYTLNACYPTTAEMDTFIRANSQAENPDNLNSEDLIDYRNWNNDILSILPYSVVHKVVIVGAALKWLTADEEGLNTAPEFTQEYTKALYALQRDFCNKVPAKYQAMDQGFVYNDAINKGISFYDGINDRYTTNRYIRGTD